MEKSVHFDNTQIGFSHKSNSQLTKMKWLFTFLNYPWIVSIGSTLALWALKLRLPFFQDLVKHTMFEQFCGGVTLTECEQVIQNMSKHHTLTVLDYGAEGKDNEADFQKAHEAFIQSLQFADNKPNIPVICIKLTSLFSFAALQKVSEKKLLSPEELEAFERGIERIRSICQLAHDTNTAVFIDAEESWIQPAIDDIADDMMKAFNHKQVVVYNTFQMYRHDRLAFLKASHHKASKNQYLFGAKIVRGAYMEKERLRAKQMGYPDPINTDKAATDRDFNQALHFLVENIQNTAFCNATHNDNSSYLLTRLLIQRQIPKDHPHVLFCQLYGMSDILTYNLAHDGFRSSKYMVYGPVKDVIPYLIRRAQENTSVSGDIGRELSNIRQEISRRESTR